MFWTKQNGLDKNIVEERDLIFILYFCYNVLEAIIIFSQNALGHFWSFKFNHQNTAFKLI